MKRGLLASALVAAFIASFAGSAAAQGRHISKSNWRQGDRGGVDRTGSPQRFALELRGGAYYPNVDEEFSGATPYKDFFGDSSRFAAGLEFSWQALRIPWVGTIGPGVGVGYTSASGKGFRVGTYHDTSLPDDYRRVGDVSLTILPMYASGVLRLDELYRRTGVPVVPYGKIGFGFALWWAEAGDSTDVTKDANGNDVLGRGISYGLHWALGGALALDWLGQRSMASLDQETGINHVYVFGEWYNQNLGLGSGQMRVGSSTWMVGLTFEM